MSSRKNRHTLWEPYNMNIQETIAGVSQNSNECDNPDRMQKSLKETERQLSCFVPHGKRLHKSAFHPQPVSPLTSLSEIQENILSHSDIERRRLQYDNAWNILENGDSRLSNYYRAPETTKQLNTSYVFVGSVQETPPEVKAPPTPSSSLTDDTSRYSGDTEYYKSKSKKTCSMEKICKYIIWILIFLGISAVVAMSIVNYQKSQANQSTNSIEAQTDVFADIFTSMNEHQNLVDKGNNDINKTLTIVLEKLDSIEKSIESIKILSKENITYIFQTNDSPNQRSPGKPDPEGQCQNTTTDGCVKDCHLMCKGDYQSCETCKGYVSCDSGHLTERICTTTSIILVWDDKLKACEHKSSTCESS